MQINLKAFCKDLNEAEHTKSADDTGLSPYLLQNLFTPYLLGKDIRLDSLDYDAFDITDLDRLNEYLGDLYDVDRKLGFMHSNLQKCAPSARKTNVNEYDVNEHERAVHVQFTPSRSDGQFICSSARLRSRPFC